MSSLPEQALQYADLVFDKISTLIKHGVWGNVSPDRFSQWKKQFVTEEEKYFAACLACQLLYYNKKDVLCLITWSFAEAVRRVAAPSIRDIDQVNDQNWKEAINNAKNRILICPFAVDNPAASGNMMTRLMRNQGLISEANLCSLEKLPERLDSKKYDAVFFVDDIIGSGQQALDFWTTIQEIGKTNTNVAAIIEKAQIPAYLVVAIAPTESLTKLERRLGFNIIAAELLTERNSTLERKFWSDDDFANGLEFLKKLEAEKRIPRIGFKQTSWAVAFEHGVPDVASPFFWEEPKGWLSLIPRRGEEV